MRRLLVALLASTLLLVGCSAPGGPDGGDGFVAGDGTYTHVAPSDRGAAVALSGKDLDGNDLATADHRGKVVVLNVWGSWCPPCRAEAPDLVKAAAETKDQAQFVGLDTRDAAPAQGQAFVRSFGIGWPSFFDPDGALLLQLRGQVPPNAIPSTLVLDAQGRVAARVVGAVDRATLVSIIRDVAAGR